MTFVQAEMMNAKTIASLLPFFVISGVVTAGMTTETHTGITTTFRSSATEPRLRPVCSTPR